MKLEEMKMWMKEHKKEVAIGAVTVAGVIACGAVFVITKKKLKIAELDIPKLPKTKKLIKLDVPESLTKIGVEEVSSYIPDQYVDIWLDMAPISELGKLGEELMTTYGLSPENCITGVVSTEYLGLEKIEHF